MVLKNRLKSAQMAALLMLVIIDRTPWRLLATLYVNEISRSGNRYFLKIKAGTWGACMDSGTFSDLRSVHSRYRTFAREKLRVDLMEREVAATASRQAWSSAGEQGLFELLIPLQRKREDLLNVVTAMEALGEGGEDLGFCLSIVAHAIGCAFVINEAGSGEQKEIFLPGLRSGAAIGACAMTELGSGSDAFSMAATARRDGDDYILDGTKLYVTNGPVADVFVIYARTGLEPGGLGVSAFAIPRSALGLDVEDGSEKLGARTANWGTLRLRGCRLPISCRLGAEGAGGSLFREAMKWERLALTAATVGAMRASLDRCLAFVKGHHRFRDQLSKYQSVLHRIVDMRARFEAGRALLHSVVQGQTGHVLSEEMVSIARLVVAESAFQNGYDEVHLRGAAGIYVNSEANLLLRNALALQSASGTQEIQKALIGSAMGLR